MRPQRYDGHRAAERQLKGRATAREHAGIGQGNLGQGNGKVRDWHWGGMDVGVSVESSRSAFPVLLGLRSEFWIKIILCVPFTFYSPC